MSEQLASHLPSLRFLDLQLEEFEEDGVELGLDGLQRNGFHGAAGTPSASLLDSDPAAMQLDPVPAEFEVDVLHGGGGDSDDSSSAGRGSLHLENLIRQLEDVERGCFRDVRATSQASTQASQDR